ncbi:hypothetical protein AAVH_01265 [Aphelenchoides avenae]|nr:hypothetical protein AAVH_01265 [Aphelenchus avenae]
MVKYTLEHVQIFKGFPLEADVYTHSQSHECGQPLEVDKVYLLSGYYYDDEKQYIHKCGLALDWNTAPEDLLFRLCRGAVQC